MDGRCCHRRVHHLLPPADTRDAGDNGCPCRCPDWSWKREEKEKSSSSDTGSGWVSERCEPVFEHVPVNSAAAAAAGDAGDRCVSAGAVDEGFVPIDDDATIGGKMESRSEKHLSPGKNISSCVTLCLSHFNQVLDMK